LRLQAWQQALVPLLSLQPQQQAVASLLEDLLTLSPTSGRSTT
jgi:hypothetical protein